MACRSTATIGDTSWIASSIAGAASRSHAGLERLRVPTLIVWGLQDIFFDRRWAYWLKDTIPGARRVVEVEDARLFFPEDRPDALVEPILQFWDELARA